MQLYKKTVRVPCLFLKALGLTLVWMLEFILLLPAYPAQTPDLTGKGRPSDQGRYGDPFQSL